MNITDKRSLETLVALMSGNNRAGHVLQLLSRYSTGTAMIAERWLLDTGSSPQALVELHEYLCDSKIGGTAELLGAWARHGHVQKLEEWIAPRVKDKMKRVAMPVKEY